MVAMLFAPNCSGLLAVALGLILTSAPKLVPQKAVRPLPDGFVLQDFL